MKKVRKVTVPQAPLIGCGRLAVLSGNFKKRDRRELAANHEIREHLEMRQSSARSRWWGAWRCRRVASVTDRSQVVCFQRLLRLLYFPYEFFKILTLLFAF